MNYRNWDIERDTLFIFQNDNGGNVVGRVGAYNAGDLARDRKARPGWEGPGHLRSGAGQER